MIVFYFHGPQGLNSPPLNPEYILGFFCLRFRQNQCRGNMTVYFLPS